MNVVSLSAFDVGKFKTVTASDASEMQKYLLPSMETSCEFSFANLMMWGRVYKNNFQVFRNRLYIHCQETDDVMFTASSTDDEPSAEELYSVSEAMREAGYSGRFSQVRTDYLERHSAEVKKYFVPELLPESFAEYVHKTENLVELHGHKLAKKKNLISQFMRDYPDVSVRPLADDDLADCFALSEEWRLAHDDPDAVELVHEADAINCMASGGLAAGGMEGVVLYSGKKVVAFATAAPINKDVWTESFEKASHEFKGAAQTANHELAKRLLGKAKYLNREQDLGMEGLRKAKQSYAPDYLLRNYRLLPK